ncbi:MAG TPA: pyridoxamine 5'-phosphate oxidase family protein [Ilumatobacter sp.]|nr:pyridoxamine 5'-phosphate oxidase family protein [Ilumatobacter sp.]
MATIPDSHADLLDGVVALTTVGPDGYPQATAVNVRLEADGKIHTSINDGRQKFRNLSARPQATVFMIDPANPYRTIEVRADAELVADPDKSWTRAFLPGFDVDAIDGDAQRYHVILTPVKVNTVTPGAW